MQSDYAYALDFLSADGKSIGQCSITPDWGPAVEWVYLEAIRAGTLPPVLPANPLSAPGHVEPVWHPRAGPPYASAFRVALSANEGSEVARDIPIAYVRSLANSHSTALIERGVLPAGDTFRYVVSAFAATQRSAPAAEQPAFAVEEIGHALPVVEGSLEAFLCGSLRSAGEHETIDLPVFVPQQLLNEAMELSRNASTVETGGVLVGRLHRDARIPELFLEITAQLPAPHTEARATKLTFTPDTWAAVRAALALRKRGESMVGWWHYHPSPCVMNNCPPEKRALCPATSAFFSTEDVALHATLFSRAYSSALLISANGRGELAASLYGWRQGMVTARGFYVLPDGTCATSVLTAAPPEHAALLTVID